MVEVPAFTNSETWTPQFFGLPWRSLGSSVESKCENTNRKSAPLLRKPNDGVEDSGEQFV